MFNPQHLDPSIVRPVVRAALLLAIAMLGVGCSASPGVQVTYDKAARFDQFQSYSWTNGRIVGVAERGYDARRADTVIRQQVNEKLNASGYHLADAGGDLVVTYQVIAETKVATTYINEPYPVRSGRGVYYDPAVSVGYSQPVATEYEAGTLIVEISNASDGGLIWRGSATRTIAADATADQREQRVREVIDQMFESFPPK